MFDSPPQQPQSIGDLIGRAFRVYRRQLSFFLKAQIGPSIGATIGRIILQYGVSTVMEIKSPHSMATGFVLGIFGFLILLVSMWLLLLRELAFARAVCGFSPDYNRAFQIVDQKKWLILGVAAVNFVLAVGVVIFWLLELALSAVFWQSAVVVSIAGFVVGAVGIVISLLSVHVVAYIVFICSACEQKQRFGSLVERGFKLVTHDFFRALVFSILLIITVSLITYPLSLPVVLLSLFEFFRHGITSDAASAPVKMPMYFLVFSEVWESMVTMLIWPVTFMSYGLLYNDLRIRQEGLDVVRSLRVLKGMEV